MGSGDGWCGGVKDGVAGCRGGGAQGSFDESSNKKRALRENDENTSFEGVWGLIR